MHVIAKEMHFFIPSIILTTQPFPTQDEITESNSIKKLKHSNFNIVGRIVIISIKRNATPTEFFNKTLPV